MKNRLENACGKIIKQTFKMASPIKKQIINSNCEVHLYIQNNAVELLRHKGYEEEADFFQYYKDYMNRGLIWADEDFKSYYHFYNPEKQKGMYGNGGNAMSVAKKYYNNAIYFIKNKDYANGLAYFGAACHIVQDVTIPQHAKGQLLDNHKKFESYVKYNYKKIKRFKSLESPLMQNSIEEYVEYNSRNALSMDYMHKGINNESVKFYLTASKALDLAQRTTAGCMIMLMKDLKKINN